MRATVVVLIGGALLAAASVAGFVAAFIPFAAEPRQFAVQINLECPAGKGDVATLQLIPEEPEFLESRSWFTLSIDQREGCERLRLKVHKSLDVDILNTLMVREPAVIAKPDSRPLQSLERVKNWREELNDFKSYDIDLTKLSADRCVGVSLMEAGRRASFDTYEYTAPFQLSAGTWSVDVIPPWNSQMQLALGERHTVWTVPPSEALKKVYYATYLVRFENFSGWRELAVILFSLGIGTGITTSVGAAWRLMASRRRTQQ